MVFMAVAHFGFVSHKPLAEFFLGLKREWASFYRPEIKASIAKKWHLKLKDTTIRGSWKLGWGFKGPGSDIYHG
jgi:hypothetical protein